MAANLRLQEELRLTPIPGRPTTGLDNPAAANPTASPAATTTYTVTVTDANNCQDSDQVVVNVFQCHLLKAEAGNDQVFCARTGGPTTVVLNGCGSVDESGADIVKYAWSTGETSCLAFHTFPEPDNYTVTLAITNEWGCTASHTVNILITSSATMGSHLMNFDILSPTELVDLCKEKPFTITAESRIEGITTSIWIEAVLPPYFRYIPGTTRIDLPKGSLFQNPWFDPIDERHLVWNLRNEPLAEMGANDTLKITFLAKPGCKAYPPEKNFFTQAIMMFEVGGGCYEVTAASNIIITEAPGLVVKKSPDLPAYYLDNEFNWTIQVENTGFGDAYGFSLTEEIGAGLELVDLDPTTSGIQPVVADIVPPGIPGLSTQPVIKGNRLIWDFPKMTLVGKSESNDEGRRTYKVTLRLKVISCENLTGTSFVETGCDNETCISNVFTSSVKLLNPTAKILAAKTYIANATDEKYGYEMSTWSHPPTVSIVIDNQGDGPATDVLYTHYLYDTTETEWYIDIASCSLPPDTILTYNDYSSSEMKDNGYGNKAYLATWKFDRIEAGESVTITFNLSFVYPYSIYNGRSDLYWDWDRGYNPFLHKADYYELSYTNGCHETTREGGLDGGPPMPAFPNVRYDLESGPSQIVEGQNSRYNYVIEFYQFWWMDGAECFEGPDTDSVRLVDIFPPYTELAGPIEVSSIKENSLVTLQEGLDYTLAYDPEKKQFTLSIGITQWRNTLTIVIVTMLISLCG